MWILVASQFRYHAGWMGLLLLPALLFAAVLTGFSVESGKVSALWMVWTLMGGMLTQVIFYHQDLRERRPLLWLELPLTPRQVIGARLMMPLLIHLPVLALAFAAIATLSPAAWNAETVGEVLAGNGLAMMVSYSIYAGEEIGIRLAKRRSLFWLAQLSFSASIVLVALDPWGWFPELEDPAGLAGLHAMAVICAVASYRMFQRRTNFLMGTDPSCGLPVDWSRAD